MMDSFSERSHWTWWSTSIYLLPIMPRRRVKEKIARSPVGDEQVQRKRLRGAQLLNNTKRKGEQYQGALSASSLRSSLMQLSPGSNHRSFQGAGHPEKMGLCSMFVSK